MTTLTGCHRVTLRPAPAYDPPFDDEREPGRWRPPERPSPSPFPRRPAGASGRPPAVVPTARHAHAPAPGSNPGPETRTAAARFLNTCLEVLNGYRPVAHLRSLSSPAQAASVTTAMATAVRRMTGSAGVATGTERPRVKLRRVRVCEPRPGVAEICAVLGASSGGSTTPGRCWAAAFRLERTLDTWRCTFARLL